MTHPRFINNWGVGLQSVQQTVQRIRSTQLLAIAPNSEMSRNAHNKDFENQMKENGNTKEDDFSNLLQILEVNLTIPSPEETELA